MIISRCYLTTSHLRFLSAKKSETLKKITIIIIIKNAIQFLFYIETKVMD